MTARSRAARGGKRGKPTLTAKRLDEMAAEATVDAYDEAEQITGWACMLDEQVEVPFDTVVLGEVVAVEAFKQPSDTRIVAVCRRGRARQAIDLLDLPLPSPAPAGAVWIEAYRHWRSRW